MSQSLHEKHMEFVDAVNASTTEKEYNDRNHQLQGFRECVDFLHPNNTLRTWADLAIMDRGETRPLCCGTLFWDYTNNCMGAVDEELRSEDAGRGHLLP